MFFLKISSLQAIAENVNFWGKLVDKNTNAPIIYANISFLETNRGITTTEVGTFIMNLPKKF